MDHKFPALFRGSADEFSLSDLYFRMRAPKNPAQITFFRVWEAITLINSDGFEKLYEQSTPMESYAAAFVQIGLPRVKYLFDHADSLIPLAIRQSKDRPLYEALRNSFDEFKLLANRFSDETAHAESIVGDFLAHHRADFSQYCEC
jgi:hypothetical protein